METSSHEHSKPNSGNLHPQLAAFDDLLTRAAASLPRINPGRVPESERTPQIELQVVSAILIQDYWKMFEGARQRSKPNPAVGYFNGMDQRFMRSAESMHAEFDNYPSAHTVIDRLMPAMQEGLFTVMDRWILLRNSESTAASTRDAPENRAYARLQTLLAEKHARRVTDLKTFFAAGMNTALASMVGSVSVVPKVFERTFGSAILRDTHAQILEQVFNFHRRMAAGNFDSFVAFANKIHGGLGGPLRGDADPELFEIVRHEGAYHLVPCTPLLQLLSDIPEAQTQWGEDSAHRKQISGCPALHARGTSSGSSNVVVEFQNWIREILAEYYLPKIPPGKNT